MSIETSLFNVVGPLFAGALFPDVAPIDTAVPYATWQQVGGQVLNPLKGTPTDHHARIQFNVWAATRWQANDLMRQLDATVRPLPLQGRPVGALIARYDHPSGHRGAQQDFTFWWRA